MELGPERMKQAPPELGVEHEEYGGADDPERQADRSPAPVDVGELAERAPDREDHAQQDDDGDREAKSPARSSRLLPASESVTPVGLGMRRRAYPASDDRSGRSLRFRRESGPVPARGRRARADRRGPRIRRGPPARPIPGRLDRRAGASRRGGDRGLRPPPGAGGGRARPD